MTTLADRAKRQRKAAAAPAAEPAANTGTDALLTAIKFIALAQDSVGEPYRTHCALWDGRAYATNGIVTASCEVPTDLRAMPHTGRLQRALEACTAATSITQTGAAQLVVKSAGLRVTVPCVGPESMVWTEPDSPAVEAHDGLRGALKAVAPLAHETAQRAALAGVLLAERVAVATNGVALLEYTHGCDLPGQWLLPRSAVDALVACKRAIAQLGFSDKSLTVYFDDRSWLKLQLYENSYPDTARLFDDDMPLSPLPNGFLQALDALTPFCTDSRIIIADKAAALNDGSNFALDADMPAFVCDPTQFKLLRTYAREYAISADARKMHIASDNVRGLLALCAQ